MKKIILLLVFIAPFITGCCTIDSQLKINDDKTASISTTINYNGSLDIDQKNDANAIETMVNKYIDDTFTTTENYESEKSVVKSEKYFTNIDKNDLNLKSLGFTSNLKSGKYIEFKKNYAISSIYLDMTLNNKNKIKEFNNIKNLKKEEKQNSVMIPEYYKRYAEQDEELDVDETPAVKPPVIKTETIPKIDENYIDKNLKTTFSITLPSFASYNNADYVRGTTYYWNIDNTQPKVIKLQYVRYSGFAIFATLLICIILLIIGAKKLKEHEAQKRQDNIQNIV